MGRSVPNHNWLRSKRLHWTSWFSEVWILLDFTDVQQCGVCSLHKIKAFSCCKVKFALLRVYLRCLSSYFCLRCSPLPSVYEFDPLSIQFQVLNFEIYFGSFDKWYVYRQGRPGAFKCTTFIQKSILERPRCLNRNVLPLVLSLQHFYIL